MDHLRFVELCGRGYLEMGGGFCDASLVCFMWVWLLGDGGGYYDGFFLWVK